MQFLHYLATQLNAQVAQPNERQAFQSAWTAWEARCIALFLPHALFDDAENNRPVLDEWLRYYFSAIRRLAEGDVLRVEVAWRQPRDVSEALNGLPVRPRLPNQPVFDLAVIEQKIQGFITPHTPFFLDVAFPANTDIQQLMNRLGSMYALMRFGFQYLPTHAVLLEDPALVRDLYQEVAAGGLETMAPFLHPRVLGTLLYEQEPQNVDDRAVEQLSLAVARLDPTAGLSPPQTLGAALLRRFSHTYQGPSFDIALASVGMPYFVEALLTPLEKRGLYVPEDLIAFEVHMAVEREHNQ